MNIDQENKYWNHPGKCFQGRRSVKWAQAHGNGASKGRNGVVISGEKKQIPSPFTHLVAPSFSCVLSYFRVDLWFLFTSKWGHSCVLPTHVNHVNYPLYLILYLLPSSLLIVISPRLYRSFSSLPGILNHLRLAWYILLFTSWSCWSITGLLSPVCLAPSLTILLFILTCSGFVAACDGCRGFKEHRRFIPVFLPLSPPFPSSPAPPHSHALCPRKWMKSEVSFVALAQRVSG